MQSATSLAAAFSLLSAAVAQTYTDCNPTEKTCSSDEGLSSSYYSVDFTKGASDDWNVTYGTITYDDTNGAAYSIAESGDAPTVQSDFYVFFGEVSVEMRAAPGTGIISCAILESDDLDEIDWEWLGGTATQVETNYFGKGNTSSYDRATYVDMADSQTTFHNYTIAWSKAEINWKIDGTVVRTLAYEDALEGQNYPQTPMRVKLGTWAGGDSSNSEGTIEWAGGETDYSDGPFIAYIKSVTIVNYNPAESYTYGDLTGSYDSIVLNGATSDDTSSSTQSEALHVAFSLAAANGQTRSTNSNSTTVASSNSTSSSGSSSSSSTDSSATSSSTSSTAATAGAASCYPNMAILAGIMMSLAFLEFGEGDLLF